METKTFDKYLAGAILKKMISAGVFPLTMPNEAKFAHLEGVGIHVSEASRKYKINLSTISTWVSKGYIRVIRMERNKKILNERDVAFIVALFQVNPGQGSKVVKMYFEAG